MFMDVQKAGDFKVGLGAADSGDKPLYWGTCKHAAGSDSDVMKAMCVQCAKAFPCHPTFYEPCCGDPNASCRKPE